MAGSTGIGGIQQVAVKYPTAYFVQKGAQAGAEKAMEKAADAGLTNVRKGNATGVKSGVRGLDAGGSIGAADANLKQVQQENGPVAVFRKGLLMNYTPKGVLAEGIFTGSKVDTSL